MSQALQKAMRKGALKTRPEVCHRKQKYDSLKIARRRSDERGLYPYHCSNCGKWHLSKLRGNKPAYDPFASQSKPQVTLQYQLVTVKPMIRKSRWQRFVSWLGGLFRV